MNPFSLENKLILVTGASSGIGKSTAIALSQLGARLILVSRSEEELEQTKRELDFSDKQHIVAPYDLNNIDGISAWLGPIIKNSGSTLDGFVYAAGIHQLTPIRALTGTQLENIMRLNVYAALQLLKVCTMKNVVSPSSSFVFISSVSGIIGEPGIVAYSTSKGALISAARSAAVELAPRNIRVNCVVPGMVESKMTNAIKNQIGEENFMKLVTKHPLGLGQPSDVAYASAYLLSDASNWVTGTEIVIDGGYSISK